MNDREKLVKELQTAQQRLGVAKYKLKQQQDVVPDLKVQISKLQQKNDKYREDLKLAYANLENKYLDLRALRRAFKVLEIPNEYKDEFHKVIAQ